MTATKPKPNVAELLDKNVGLCKWKKIVIVMNHESDDEGSEWYPRDKVKVVGVEV